MRKPLLIIPSTTEGSGAFRERLVALIKADQTHIYVDTSFLMWMTKIGSNSRQELIAWLRQNCAGRVHVPIWAAHEYLKHHVAGTIIAELSERTNEVVDLVGRTYTYFRPFIDEPSGEGAEDPSSVRAATRAALNALDRLAGISGRWHKSYQKHASEVIAFINEVTPDETSVYQHLADIAQVGAIRFVGSIPPGFQDRRKKGSAPQPKGNEANAPAGSNRYGDLLFWKELLAHAKGKAKAIIVLTNDRKNDWHMGRSEVVDIDPALLALKKAWKPVPRAHPMLIMEAKLLAEVEEVELLDSLYLAALLREVAVDEVRAFADVAIIPDGPQPEKEGDRRAKLYEERLIADAATARAQVVEKGYLFQDAQQVLNSRTAFQRALYESRGAISTRSEALLNEWRANVEAKRPLSEMITQDKLDGIDYKDLVRLARELHDRVLSHVPGYDEAVADLVSILDILPLNTAASFYLGLLASMYLQRETNATRLPPSSPVAQLLFDRQADDYAQNGVTAIAKRLTDNEFAPLYVPNVDLLVLTVSLDTEPDTPELDELRSMRINGVELLTAAQADDTLRLAALFETDRLVNGDAIVRKASELFAFPMKQVMRGELFEQAYTLTDTIGFKRPVDILIPKDKSLGD